MATNPNPNPSPNPNPNPGPSPNPNPHPHPHPNPNPQPKPKPDQVKSADDLTNRPFSFTVQVPERNYFLAAMSDADRNEWVAAIGRATTESRP